MDSRLSGKNDAGIAVKPGVYILTLQTGNGKTSERIVVIK